MPTQISSLHDILHAMIKYHASDAFLAVGSPIILKCQGQNLLFSNEPLSRHHPLQLLSSILPSSDIETLTSNHDLNTSYMLDLPSPGSSPLGGVFRISAFRQRSSYNAVIRYIPQVIPTLAELRLPQSLSSLATLKRGLVLVVGSTGSGKSTTLASLLHHRNTTTPGHILTVEDPIEFLHRNQQSIISQREIGRDCPSLNVALKNALRQSPDCILIGEIRDRETFDAALSFALSGHLVLSTLHANSSVHALSRIASFYPQEARPQLLHDLSSALQSILCQRLLSTTRGSRVPAFELLHNTPFLRDAIQKGDWAEVRTNLENSTLSNVTTFEQSIAALIKSGLVSQPEGLSQADSPSNLLWLLNNAPSSQAPKNPDPSPQESPFPNLSFDHPQ